MRKNLVTTIIIQIALGLMLFLGILFSVIRYNMEQNSIEMGKTIAYSAIKSYENTSLSDVDFVAAQKTQNKNIAIISRTGDVLANSNPLDKLDNPLDLPELIDLDQPVFRFSKDLEKDMLYIALESKGKLVRVSISMTSQMNRYHSLAVYSILLSVLLLIGMTFSLNYEKKKFKKNVRTVLSDIHTKQTTPSHLIRDTEYDTLNEIVWLLNKVMPTAGVDSKETLRILLNEMNQGIILVNSEAKIVLFNNLANNLLQIKEGEKVMFQIREKDVYETIIKATTNPLEEVIRYDYNGKHINVMIKSVQSPLLNKETNKLGVLVILMDDTKSFILDKNKRDFFANASHELRTPLTSIKGSAELINLKMVNEETQRELSNQIMESVTIMDELINDMLELSKLQSNPPKTYRSNNLKNIINQSLELLDLNIKEKNITLNIDLDNVQYLGSEQDFRSLFKNLIENSIKYNKQHGFINITLKPKEKGFIFTIKDTGIGISKENQSRIFERFYQVDKGRNYGVSGTGLGLSIVKHIVILYEGTIELESVPNEGTTIKVSLP